MQEFLLETKTGQSLRWLALLILLAIPLTQIVSQLYSVIITEGRVFGTEQATPIEQKTPLGKILQALDTQKTLPESRVIFDREKSQLPTNVRDYFDKFFDFYDRYVEVTAPPVNLSHYEHLITGAAYIRDYMANQKVDSRSAYRAFEVVPFTFIKMAYRAHIKRAPISSDQLIDLCTQYQKSIVESLDDISGRGATVFCIKIRIEYLQALGGVFTIDKTDQLKIIQSKISEHKEKYPNALGEKGNLKDHIYFLESYYKSAEVIINEKNIDKGIRIFLGAKSDPIAKIPGIDI
jgi:hypothetical protein